MTYSESEFLTGCMCAHHEPHASMSCHWLDRQCLDYGPMTRARNPGLGLPRTTLKKFLPIINYQHASQVPFHKKKCLSANQAKELASVCSGLC